MTDKRVVDDYENAPLVCHVTAGKIYKECYKAVKYIYENMDKFEYPAFLLHGEGDKIVWLESVFNYILKKSVSIQFI